MSPSLFHLEIVTHCYNYRRLWAYQISSLRLFPPENVQVTYTLWHTSKADPETARWIEWYAGKQWPQRVAFNPRDIEPERCFNRCIGRNITCRETTADYVFLTDCDIVFGPGCCDSFATGLELAKDPILAHPQYIYRQRSQRSGDAMIARVTGPGWHEIEPGSDRFVHHHQKRCSGGLFIFRGEEARSMGYLDADGWRRWNRPAKQWIGTISDKRFRTWVTSTCGVLCEPVAVREMYLLRHTQRGHLMPGVEL